MAEIDSHPLIPIFRRHVRIRMPVVAGCVVHKNVDRAESGLGLCNRSSQHANTILCLLRLDRYCAAASCGGTDRGYARREPVLCESASSTRPETFSACPTE